MWQQYRSCDLLFLVLLAFICLSGHCQGQGIVNFCHQYTFFSSNTSSPHQTGLQLTREISTRDYAIYGKFKSIHCCARGYRSIEWYKDGRPYPWSRGESSLILYPESANQTVYTQTVERTDAGNYTCLVRNDTHSLWSSIRLSVLDMEDYSGSPLATYEPDDQYVQPGDTTRFFCEAFVGHMGIGSRDTGGVEHAVTWRREGQNATVLEHSRRFEQLQVPRENFEILGGYLTIRDVQQSDLGRYTCSIAVSGQPRMQMNASLKLRVATPEPAPVSTNPSGVFLVACVACLALVLTLALYYHLRLRLLLLFKDFFSSGDKHDPGKEFDVFICYVAKDSEFAVGELLPALEKRFHYQCCVHQLQPDGCGRLAQLAQVSRRLVMVVSPALAEQHATPWSAGPLTLLVAHLAQLHPSTVFILTQNPPSSTDGAGRELTTTLQKTRHLVWPCSPNTGTTLPTQFWLRLCLLLPARRPLCSPRSRQSNGNSNSQTVTNISAASSALQSPGTEMTTKKLHVAASTSHESLEVLV